MAELTEQVIRVAETQWRWDEDLRQDFYLHWLESPEPEVEFTSDAHMYSFITSYYHNLEMNLYAKNKRRVELLFDNADEVIKYTAPEQGDDPMDICMAEEEVGGRLAALSPLLYDTLVDHAVNGMTASEIADRDGVAENVVYQRIHKAKQLVKGEL